MKEITVSAKTLDEAITEALIQLEITSDLLDYDVVEKGSGGFLGIGSKQAVINARKKVEKEPIAETLKKTDKKPVEENTKNSSKAKNEWKQQKEYMPEIKDDTKEECEKFLYDIFKVMGMEVELISKIDRDGILNIEMKGDNMGIIIGKRGQTLDSLQYLLNRVASKMQNCYIPVKLDTENYRRRRRSTLENLAKNVAFKVKKTKRPVSLEPMNPYERRIIHSVLQGDKQIATYSEGEEPFRCVVVTYRR